MPTIIHEQFAFDPAAIETGFQPNTGKPITTKSILDSMEKLNLRPEIKETSRLIRESGQYIKGVDNA